MMIKLRTIYEKMTNREKIILYVAIGFIVLMVTDLIVLHPIMSELKVLDSKIKTESQEIQRDMRILSFKDSILKEYRNYESYLDVGVQSQEEIIGKLLKKLENLSSQNEIKMSNVMPGEIEDKPIYKVYSTTLDFEGSLRSVLVFMNLLEESDNLFQVTRYTMEPKNRSGQLLKVNMDISRILINSEDLSDIIEDEASVEDPVELDQEVMEDADFDMEVSETESGGDMEMGVMEAI
jgi:hypothetical protein